MTTTANKPTTPRRRGKPPTPIRFEQGTMADRPGMAKRVVGGVEVIDEQPIYLNPKGGATKISRIKLADGTETHGCRDCEFTGTRGEVMAHRNAEHGTRYGKGVRSPKEGPGDIMVPERANGVIPQGAEEMTLAEVIALMPTIRALGDLIERLEIERNEAVLRARSLEQFEHRNATKINGYDAMRDEVLELRAWKKKIVQRLSPLGFKLEEEE